MSLILREKRIVGPGSKLIAVRLLQSSKICDAVTPILRERKPMRTRDNSSFYSVLRTDTPEGLTPVDVSDLHFENQIHTETLPLASKSSANIGWSPRKAPPPRGGFLPVLLPLNLTERRQNAFTS